MSIDSNPEPSKCEGLLITHPEELNKEDGNEGRWKAERYEGQIGIYRQRRHRWASF